MVAFSLFTVNASACFLGLFGCQDTTFIIIDSDLNIGDLNNVQITDPMNHQLLVFDAPSLLWVNRDANRVPDVNNAAFLESQSLTDLNRFYVDVVGDTMTGPLVVPDINAVRINVDDLNAQDATHVRKGILQVDPSNLSIVDGVLDFDLNTENLLESYNGVILESIDVDVNSTGTDVNLFLGSLANGELTLKFQTAFFKLVSDPPLTVELTAGSDTAPTLNYVFIPEDTLVLTANTSGFPTTVAIAPVATVEVQSAASIVIDGAYKVHAWTDHTESADTNQGHLSHLNAWIRTQPATWRAGVLQTLTITSNASRPDNVDFAVSSGTVLQLHDHAFPAFDTAGDSNIFVVNDFVTPFLKVDDLNALLTDSLGGSMSNRFFTLVIWGVVNEDLNDSKLMVNLPSGSYNMEATAIADASGFASFDIPIDFVGTGFLISKLVLRNQAASGGTWTSIQETDLRGLFPSTGASGGSGAALTAFPDNLFELFNVTDSTKELMFNLAPISTGTRRLWNVKDGNGTVPLLEIDNAWSGTTMFLENVTFENPLQIDPPPIIGIKSDGTNLVIDRNSSSPDIIINAPIKVTQSINEFSSFGPSPTHLTPSDVQDMLSVTKQASATGTRRGALFVVDFIGTSSVAGIKAGANTIAFTTDDSNGSLSLASASGGLVGNRSAARHRGNSVVALGGGVSANALIQGDSDGNYFDAYGFQAEGIDGGSGVGKIFRGHNVLIRSCVGNVDTCYGITIEEQSADKNSFEVFLQDAGGIYFRDENISISSSAPNVLNYTVEDGNHVYDGNIVVNDRLTTDSFCGVPGGVFWAEEVSPLNTGTAGGKQFSFGNGNINGDGITQVCSGRVVALSLVCENDSAAATGVVQIMVNGSAAGCAVSTSNTANDGNSTVDCIVSFDQDDEVGPITTTSDASADGCVPTWWVVYD